MKYTILLSFLTLIAFTQNSEAFKNNACMNEGKVSLVRIDGNTPPGLRLYICKNGENVDPTARELIYILSQAKAQGKDTDKWAGILTANTFKTHDELITVLASPDVESISITNIDEGKFQRGQDSVIKQIDHMAKELDFTFTASKATPVNTVE